MAAFDPKGHYVSNNMFVLIPAPEATMRFRKALVALLNSRFMTWYFRAVQPRAGRIFAELKLVHLRDFPMPAPERWQQVEASLARLETKARARGGPAVADEVDKLVERAFEFSPQEREVIRLSS